MRCLDLPELLFIICEELRSSSSFGSLAAFAATNSSICDVALDALWQKQECLVPLLKTLQRYTMTHSAFCIIHLELVRRDSHEPISPAAWARMRNYASRITCLHLHGRGRGLRERCSELALGRIYYEIDIGRETLQFVSEAAEPEPLFPRLKVLDWTMPDPHLLPLIPMLYSPLIEQMTLRSKHCGWLVQRLSTFCPGITALTVLGDLVEMSSPTSDILTEAMSGLHNLASVTVSNASPKILSCIDRLPSLRSLQLLVGEQFALNISPGAAAPSLPFEKVMQRVRLHLETPNHFEHFFRHVRCPLKIVELDVECCEDWDPDDLSAVDIRQRNLDLITNAVDPADVDHITYYQDCSIEPVWGLIPAASILGLAACYPRLSYLGISCWIDTSNADLLSLARALPLLEFLILDTHCLMSSTDLSGMRTTLAVLPRLAHLLPHLRGLCIRLSAVHVPTSPTGPEDQSPVRGHVRLYFSNSEIGDPIAVADFLKRVFPRGCSLAHRPPREGAQLATDEFWDEQTQEAARNATKPLTGWQVVRQLLLEDNN
ncbi:hypothetical protein HDZ31DRAFT_48163 [Schizophyllum fasciatum]